MAYIYFTIGIATILLANNCYAQSFREAALLALENSPLIKAENSRLDAISEQKTQAYNLRRPTIQLEASGGLATSGQWLGPFGTNRTDWQGTEPMSLSVTASQPLLNGGRFQASLREAQLKYAQALAKLNSLELLTIRNVIEAYSDVLRDHAILEIRQDGVKNLKSQLNATEARKELGLIGLTDVAQAQTRLSAAEGQLASAKARLMSSWAILQRQIGQKPVGLSENSIVVALPKTLNDALETARKFNLDIKIARFNDDIAKANARTIQTETNPRLSLNTSTIANIDSGFNGARGIDAQINARLVIPIWSAGQPQSRVRAALSESNAARFEAIDIEQQLTERITIGWENINAAKENVRAAEAQVAAAEIAREGADLEQRIGSRTTLDVLNQEQEVLDSKVNLANARRELLVSGVSLLILMGIDPINIISEDRYINNKIPNPLNERFGVPTKWERPLIFMHDIMAPIDSSISRQSKSVKLLLGPEQ